MNCIKNNKIKKSCYCKKWKKVVMKILVDYAKESSIHGLRFLCEGKWFVGIFWLIALTMSICGCSYQIYETFKKWEESPVIVSIDEGSTPIWNVPFPAVTICPEILFKKSMFNLSNVRYFDANNKLTNQEVIFHNVLNSMCPFSYPVISILKFDIIKELKKISVPMDEVFSYFGCTWRGKNTRCASLFSEVITSEGICYTFNMLDHKDLLTDIIDDSYKYPNHDKRSTNWTLENGYKTNNVNSHPLRPIGAGFEAGLMITLLANKSDIDYKCKGALQGFKLAIHSATDVPRFSKQFFRIPFQSEVLLAVNPNMVKTSHDLKHYKPKVRQCYFDGERKLNYFKVYTQSNCEYECLTKFTDKTCGCVRFGMLKENSSIICNFTQQACYTDAEANWIMQSWDQNYAINNDCNCLPSCNSIEYDAVPSYGHLFDKEVSHAYGMENSNDSYASQVKIYFKINQFFALKRSELFGVTEFLSTCGGLLGLFMGFSILSLIEFIYYMSIRWVLVEPELVDQEIKDDLEQIQEIQPIPSIVRCNKNVFTIEHLEKYRH